MTQRELCNQCQNIDFAAVLNEALSYGRSKWLPGGRRRVNPIVTAFRRNFEPLELGNTNENGNLTFKVKDCPVCEFLGSYTIVDEVKYHGATTWEERKPFPTVLKPCFPENWQYYEGRGLLQGTMNRALVLLQKDLNALFSRSTTRRKTRTRSWLPHNHTRVKEAELHLEPVAEYSRRDTTFSISIPSHLTCRRRASDAVLPRRRHVEASSINYQLLKRWLSVCDMQPPCGIRPPNTTFHYMTPIDAVVHYLGIRLIDCHASPLRVIDAKEDTEYLALSYVWGVPDLCPLEEAPQVVLDAITVTLNIGKRYLWVDKYCVEQEDEAIKTEQVQKMGNIFESAYATIVAAVGDNERYGLCGVSRDRDPISFVELPDGIQLIGEAEDGIYARKGTWNSRGWCLQEQLCSRRLPIFASQEVNFECKHMRCRESLEAVDVKLGGPFNLLCAHSKHSMHTNALEDSVGIFWDCVISCMDRQLSYDDDAQKAFLGVVHRMDPLDVPSVLHPVLCFLAMPVLGHLKLGEKLTEAQEAMLMVESLAWEGEVLKRRPCILPSWPSWTWLA